MTDEARSKTLWFNAQKTQYYLIPDDATLPEGTLALHSLTGRTQHVAPDAVRVWAVSEAEARAHVESSSLRFLQRVTGPLAGLLSNLKPSAQSGVGAGSAVGLLALFMGLSPQMLRENPELGRIGLANFIEDLADVLADVISEDPARMAQARARVRAFHDNLQDLGVEGIDPRLVKLPDKVQAWYEATSDPAAFHRFEQLLRETAEQMRAPDGEAGPHIQKVLAEFSQGLRDVFEAEESPEEQERRYHKMARESIEASVGTPEFDFKKLWSEYRKEETG